MSPVMVFSTKVNVPLEGHAAVHNSHSTFGYDERNQRIYSVVVIPQILQLFVWKVDSSSIHIILHFCQYHLTWNQETQHCSDKQWL
jgi:hypothetical protein